MTLYHWELLATACAMLGGLALLCQQALRLASHLQVRTLTRRIDALQRWWMLVTELPEQVLTPELRRIVGRIMLGHLECAQRWRHGHDAVQMQRDHIERFVAQPPVHWPRLDRRAPRGNRADRLRALLELLTERGNARLVERTELAAARAGVARQLDELEFLAAQRARLPADDLRRMTRALAPGGGQTL